MKIPHHSIKERWIDAVPHAAAKAVRDAATAPSATADATIIKTVAAEAEALPTEHIVAEKYIKRRPSSGVVAALASIPRTKAPVGSVAALETARVSAVEVEVSIIVVVSPFVVNTTAHVLITLTIACTAPANAVTRSIRGTKTIEVIVAVVQVRVKGNRTHVGAAPATVLVFAEAPAPVDIVPVILRITRVHMDATHRTITTVPVCVSRVGVVVPDDRDQILTSAKMKMQFHVQIHHIIALEAQTSTLSAQVPCQPKVEESAHTKHDVEMVSITPAIESNNDDEKSLSRRANHDNLIDSRERSQNHLPSRSPSHRNSLALPSQAPNGLITPAKSVTDLDQVPALSPRSALTTSTLMPPRPAVNPIVDKWHEAKRESYRAYLKSNSDYNRAEMKYLSVEAELRLTEFWLGVVTKNLEDVGKRIEVHDWNFQKITNQIATDDA
ncbi:hypothetical protein CCR75_002889 [Bremia lactucae]|uniref:Uncharacterized protein n=1 Tax=Bremia lactucae TaxID=4779 RepID=A0A976IEP9_BRELC|nr:hypothetical protein CCR75_002889 [Bremia lactucae]